MPKRHRDDEASLELIASLQDADALEAALRNFECERASIQKVFDDARADILKKYKTDDPDKLSERDQIRFTTEVEYEQGLCDDRLVVLDNKIDEYKQKHSNECSTRKRRRILDRQITECADIAEQEPANSNWKLMGKVKHVQTALNEKVSEMSPQQIETYTSVLKELKKKGWRVLKCTYLNSSDSSDATPEASE